MPARVPLQAHLRADVRATRRQRTLAARDRDLDRRLDSDAPLVVRGCARVARTEHRIEQATAARLLVRGVLAGLEIEQQVEIVARRAMPSELRVVDELVEVFDDAIEKAPADRGGADDR